LSSTRCECTAALPRSFAPSAVHLPSSRRSEWLRVHASSPSAPKAQVSSGAWGSAPGFMEPNAASAESAIHFRRQFDAYCHRATIAK
jgi:hypothetical protein